MLIIAGKSYKKTKTQLLKKFMNDKLPSIFLTDSKTTNELAITIEKLELKHNLNIQNKEIQTHLPIQDSLYDIWEFIHNNSNKNIYLDIKIPSEKLQQLNDMCVIIEAIRNCRIFTIHQLPKNSTKEIIYWEISPKRVRTSFENPTIMSALDENMGGVYK